MKIVKRILLFFALFIVLLLGAAAAFPFLFKGKILAAVKEEVNKSLQAHVDFADVSLSLFRDFPNVAVGLKNYSITGTGQFEGITLAKGDLLDVGVNLSSFWGEDKPLRINSVHLKKPVIKVYVLEDGTANYNIVKMEETVVIDSVTGEPIVVEPTPFEINLEAYSISGGDILYQDATSDLYLQINGLNHRGKGNFTQDVYDLATNTKIDAMTLRYGAIPYLKDARVDLKATFNVEVPIQKYTLKENSLRINDLLLDADGYVQLLENDAIGMDLTLTTPQNDFKNLFSLVPNAYIEGYEKVKAGGTFELKASASGVYDGVKETYPAFNVRLAVADGNVQYPGMPMAIQNIQAEMEVNSPGGSLDAMTISVPRFGLLVGKRPFDLAFFLKTPLSDPDVDAKVKGEVHLNEWAQAFPMDGVSGGVIRANARVKTRMSYVDNGQYDRVDMSGTVDVQNLKYKSQGMPTVWIKALSTAFTPQRMQVDRFDAKFGDSDLQAKGSIRNALAYFSPKKTMYGDLSVRSEFFNLNDWMPQSTADTEPVPSAVSVQAAPTGESVQVVAPVPVFDRFDFTLDANFREIVYADYRLRNVFAQGNIKPNRLEVDDAGLLIADSDVRASGTIINMFDYLFENGILGGNLKVQSKLMNLNQFMGSPSSDTPQTVPSSGTGYEPVLVPANVRMAIDADIDRILYTDYELRSLRGKLIVEDQAVVIQDAVAGFLGGKVGLTGSYDTRDAENPAFSIKYDMRDMSFSKVFNALNTYKMLSPLAGFLEGNFNTALIMDGKLNKDLTPQLQSLNAQGFLETLNGIITGFKPFQELGNMLNVDYLKDNIRITNTKNWFEIQNGIIELKEFDYKLRDIDMKISGMHALTQDMHYKIKARIPRKLLEKNPVGANVSRGYDIIRKEAAKFGVNIQKSEFVNVLINITGSTTDPKITLNLLGADGETPLDEAAQEAFRTEVEKAKTEAKQQAEQKLEEGKQIVRETAEKAIDSVRTVASQKLEEAEQKAREAVKEKVEEALSNKVDSATLKKATDIIDKSKEAERIKQELERFNPLRKKKEGGG